MRRTDGTFSVLGVEPGPIRPGDLVRRMTNPPGVLHQLVVTYLYGTVLETKFPMRDDPEWADHLVLWHDGEQTWWWCGDLELVARKEEGAR